LVCEIRNSVQQLMIAERAGSKLD